MSKYKPLSDFLSGHKPDTWRTTFDEVEKTLGAALPKTAREKAAWWDNGGDPPKLQAKAWLDHGWTVSKVDLTAGAVHFKRAASSIQSKPAAPAPDPTAREAMTAADTVYELTRAADVAKKVGLAAAVLGVLAGAGVLARNLLGRRR